MLITLKTIELLYLKKKLIKKVWDNSKLKCVSTLEGHSNFVLCLKILSDGVRLASGSADKKIKVWSCDGANQSKELQTLSGHSGWINSIEVTSLSTSQILSCSHDKTVKLWNLEDGTCIRTFQGHTEFVYCIRSNVDGKVISGK